MHDKTAMIPGGSKARGNIGQRRWKATALASAVALTLLGASLDAQAVALGAVTVRSALGEPLRAEIEVPQISSEEASSFKAALGSIQTFQTAGVEYNRALAGTRVSLQRRANGQAYLRVEGGSPINEPFLSIVIEADWGKGGHIVRDYALLIDPPARPKPPVQPNLPQAEQVTRPVRPPVVVAPVGGTAQPRGGAAVKPAKTPASAPSGEGGGQVTVSRGDTASSILNAHPVAGVSLDQMLIALLRANPHAFINNNVNRMRSGAVLTLPTAEQASALSPQAARRNFIAQVHEFNDYRNGLAQHPKQVANASSQSSTKGAVQSLVPSNEAPKSPDKVVVSPAGSASDAERKASLNREEDAQRARQAELDRTRQQLEDLQRQAAKASQSQPANNTVVADSKPAQTTPPGIQLPIPGPTPAPSQPPPVTQVQPSETPPSAASAQIANPPVVPPSAAGAVTPPPEPPKPVPVPVPPPPKPKVVPPPPPPPAPSFMDTLGDNLLGVVLGGVLLVVVVIGGLYYSSRRKKKTASSFDSSFIESRLQPDSFFGASGGQRVNTREEGAAAGGGNSSLAYSPSQLDAAGDVDPVAEADVYLAYGRDQQAEEILREALRTHQGRVAIHRKLAEIYAKRRDARALQAIATEARGLTHGSGPDWQAIAALGMELEPGNALYGPGDAQPRAAAPAAAPAAPAPAAPARPQLSDVNPRGVGPDTITMPMPLAPTVPVDLDLDLGQEAASGRPSRAAPLPTTAATQPVDLDLGMNFTPPPEPAQSAPAPAAKPGSNPGMMEFDMGSLSAPDSRSTDQLQTKQPPDADEDPIGTKLALAQEFHAIGDDDGARALIKEVIAEAKGSMKARAERFLAELN